MRILIKIAAVAGALLCSAAAAQADQQDSTEAGTSYFGGAYAQYGGDYNGGGYPSGRYYSARYYRRW